MGFFSKPNNPIDDVSKTFLDRFPAWSVQHATELVGKLKSDPEHEVERTCSNTIKENSEIEQMLIDALTGAHAVYLHQLPEGVLAAVGGRDNILKAISKWPKSIKDFVLLTLTYQQKLPENKKLDMVTSLGELFGAKKLDPVAVDIGAVATSEIENKLNLDLGIFFVAGLYGTIFQLQHEQLNWLSDEIISTMKID